MPKSDVVAKKPDKVKLQSFLMAHGHKKSDLDKKKWDTEADIKKSLREIHGVTEQEYKQAGGTVDA